jgi:hypothetical protein
MAYVEWNVRERGHTHSGGAVLARGYRSAHPVIEPKVGEVLHLHDGSAWRIVDWLLADSRNPGNVLVVEPAGR